MLPMLFAILASVDETVTLRTPDGALFTAYIDKPSGAEKAPAVVLAPGQSYHRKLPLVADVAAGLRAKGFLVATFDWQFFERGSRPSAGLEVETAQLSSVVEHLRIHPGVDQARVVLAGNSLGSVAAWGVFVKSDWLAGLVVTTPLMPTLREARRNYPGIESTVRPVSFIVPEGDPKNVPIDVARQFFGSVPTAVSWKPLPGDQSFEVADGGSHEGPSLNEASVKDAVDAMVRQIESVVRP